MLHKDFANYSLEYFEMEGFESGPYLGLTYFRCLMGFAQIVDQGHPNHQDYVSLSDRHEEYDLVD